MSKEDKKSFLDKRHQKNSNGNGNGAGTQANDASSNVNNTQQNQQQGQNNQNTPTLNSIMNNGVWHTSGQGLTRCVGHYEVGCNANIVLLDSGADTCLCGQDFVVLKETDGKVDVNGYNDNVCTKDVTIRFSMTLAITSDGTEVLLRVNEGLLFEQGKSLFSTTQIKHFKHHTDDTQGVLVERDVLMLLKVINYCSTLIMEY